MANLEIINSHEEYIKDEGIDASKIPALLRGRITTWNKSVEKFKNEVEENNANFDPGYESWLEGRAAEINANSSNIADAIYNACKSDPAKFKLDAPPAPPAPPVEPPLPPVVGVDSAPPALALKEKSVMDQIWDI